MSNTKRNFQSNRTTPTVKDVMAARQMSLKDAYRIALSIKNVSAHPSAKQKVLYSRALDMISRHNSAVAEHIRSLFGDEVSIRSFSVEQLETLLMQLSTYLNEETKDKVQAQVLADNDVNDALSNTKYADDKGNNLSDQETQRVNKALLDSAYGRTVMEMADNGESFDVSSVCKNVKKKVLQCLRWTRALTFMDRKEDWSPEGMRDAFDLKKVCRVSVNKLEQVVAKEAERFQRIKERFCKRYENSKPRLKALANKCATLALAVVVTSSSILASCTHKQGSDRTPTDVAKELGIQPNDTVRTPEKTLTIEVADSVKNNAVEEVADTIRAPQEWNDSLGVSKAGFNATVKWCNKTFNNKAVEAGFEGENAGFEYAYSKAATLQFDSLDVNPMQTLRAYVYDRSFYPNPDVKGLNPEHANASRAAVNLEKFINCGDQLSEDMSNLFIDQIKGELNIRAVYVEDPCGGSKVIFKSTATPQKKQVQEEVQEEAPADTTKTQFTFSNGSSFTLEGDTIRTDASGNAFVSIKKGNNLDDGKEIDKRSLSDVTGLGVKDKVVMASVAPVDSADTAEEVSLDGFTFTTSTNFGPDAEKSGVSVADSSFAEKKFEFTSSSNLTSSEQADSLTSAPVSKSDSIDSKAFTAPSDSIVIGTDVPLGTPSAGNHEKRGGVDGSGITADQRHYIDVKLGKETADFIRENIPAWLTNRGGAAEGCSNDEVLYCFAVMSVTAPNSPETRAVFDYTIGCKQGQVMEKGLAGRVKKVIDGIHKNKTRDDMVYTKGTIVDNVEYNGCDKKQTVHQRTAPGGRVEASGPYFDRMFRIPVKAPAFTFSQGSSFTTIEEEGPSIDVTANIAKMKGNNLNDGKKVGDLSQEYVLNLTTKDQTIMYSGDRTEGDNVLIKKGNNLEDGKTVAQVPAEEVTKLSIKKKKACYQRKEAAKKAKREKANACPVAKSRG